MVRQCIQASLMLCTHLALSLNKIGGGLAMHSSKLDALHSPCTIFAAKIQKHLCNSVAFFILHQNLHYFLGNQYGFILF